MSIIEFKENILSNGADVHIEGNVSAIERVILSQCGTLQRTLSALLNKPIHFIVKKNVVEGSKSHRIIHIICENLVLCIAESKVTATESIIRELELMGIGQYLKDKQTSIEVHKMFKDGSVLHREYTLYSNEFNARIKEQIFTEHIL